MSEISRRSERVAGLLAGQALGAEVVPLVPGHAMDFSLTWPDGRSGFLEATMVTHPDAIKWQSQLADDGGSWPAKGKWELRLTRLVMTYRPAREATTKVVELCDMFGVDAPEDLPEHVQYREPAVAHVTRLGELRRVEIGREGVAVFVPARIDWPDQTDPDFAHILTEWATLPHLTDHIAKTIRTSDNSHLFLVPLDDVLPSRFFTDDFDPPSFFPLEYNGLAGLWVWSNFWHRFLGWTQDSGWRWHSWV